MPTSTSSHNRYRSGRQPPALLRGSTVLKGLCAVLLLLNLLLVYGLVLGSKGWRGYLMHHRQVIRMSQELHNLKEQNQELYGKIHKLKSDPIAQERLIRQQLGWVRGNEWIIEFHPPPPHHGR